MADLNVLSEAIIKGDQATAVEVTRSALEEGMAPETILEEGLIAGMNIIGVRFKANEVYIPEVLIAARAMKMAMEVLEPKLAEAGIEPVGKAMIGTVQGDLHDIGKNLVRYFMEGAGFKVVDLGKEVTVEKFIEGIKKEKADILAMSALITTTMPYFKKVIESLKKVGLRDKVKVMVGGAPVTPEFAKIVGADAYGEDAAKAVKIARNLIEELREKG